MKFDVEIPTCREGVFVPVNFATPEEVIQTIQLAERLGYYAVWGTDFINPTHSRLAPNQQQPNWHEIMITLAYAAAVTTKVKLVGGVIVLPQRDPVILAKQIATLDQFSGGRFILGIGLGDREEFETIMPKYKGAHRGRMLDERLEALILLLSHEQRKVSFKGEYVEFNDVNLNPKPIQNPLPIFTPGRSQGALRRIAKHSLGFMIRNSDAEDRMEAIKPALEEYGRDISELDIVSESHLCLAKTHDLAVERYKNSYLGNRSKAMNLGNQERTIDNNWVGTAEEVVEKMAKTKALGISHYLALHIAGDTLGERFEQMQRFAEEVVPQVKSA